MLQIARRVPRVIPALLLVSALPFGACQCDDVLGGLPAPIAILVAGSNEAPPLDHLEVGLAPTSLGAAAPIELTVRNDGNADLVVSDVVLTSNAEWCPAPSAAFTITEPAAIPRAMTIGEGSSGTVRLSFTPTSGQPACAVVEVRSNDAKHPTLYAVLRGQGDAPQLCTDRAVIDFGEVLVGDTKPDTIHVTSCGTRPIDVGSIAQNAQLPDPFQATLPVTPATLAPGEAMDIPVAFSPLVPGSWSVASGTSGALTLDVDAGSQTYRIDLVGSSREPPRCHLQAIPDVVQFGSVGAARTATQNVLIRNIGALDCTLTSADIVEPAGSFSRAFVDISAGQVLAPLQSGTLTVTFAPAVAAGAESGVLRIVSTDPVTPQLDVPLQGTSVEVTPCFLEANPTAVNFGFQPMLRTTQREVILTNVGVEDCMVNQIEITSGAPEFGAIEPPFSALPFPFNQLFGSFVPAGESVSFVVSFRPEQAGPRSGNLEFTYKEFGIGNPDQLINVPMTGNGVAPCITVTPLDHDFGALAIGASGTVDVNISNCGGADLFVRGIGLRGGSHPDFSLTVVAPQPSAIPPGGSQAVTVRAAPTAQGQTNAGAAMFGFLDVLTDTAPAVVSLRANSNGACTEGLQCVPTTLAFGDVLEGDVMVRSIVCSNPGTQAVSLAPTVAAPFEVVSAPASIAPGTSGVIRVRFTANDTAVHTATVDIGANTCAGAPASVAVNGRGVVDELPPCPTPTVFNPQTTWEWDGGGTAPNSRQTWSSALVARLNDTNNDGVLSRDDMPRVVFISFDQDDAPEYLSSVGVSGSEEQVNDPVPGVLRALSGDTGVEVWTNDDLPARFNSSVTPAIVDLDGDGCVETIGSKYVLLPGVEAIPNGPKVHGKFNRGNLLAIDCRGDVKWESEEWLRNDNELEDAGGPAVGDVDGDGFAEVALGATLYDHNGRVLFRGARGTGSTGHGPTSVLADVDGLPGLELVAGPTVYRADGSILWDRLDDLGDAHPAVADLDGDGFNEVVLRNAEVTVLDGRTGATLAGPKHPPTDMAMGDECQPGTQAEGEDDPCNIIPTNTAIMDVDGNGQLDIAVSAQGALLVYRPDLSELYRAQIWDGTGASGPAGFDFEADGNVNVVYSDEGNIWSWTSTGSTIYDAERSSVTMMEYATIADIDNDGHANILAGSNEPQFDLAQGLDAFENTGTKWANARAMWNQHAYAEELISELGTPTWVDSGPGTLHGFRTASARCIP